MADRHKGFTLIELAVAMAVIAVLLGLGIPQLTAYLQNAKVRAAAAPVAALPLFTASDASGTRQQITKVASVIAHPAGGVLVIFGTGSWLDTEDAQGPYATDSLYGIWDRQDGTRVTRSRLQRQQVLMHVSLDNAGRVRSPNANCTAGEPDCYVVVSNCAVNYTSGERVPTNLAEPLCPAAIARAANEPQQLGWVLDLPGNGERTRSSAPFFNGMNVGFTTLTPSPDLCQGSTVGMEYQLSALSGGAPTTPIYYTGSASGLTLLTPVSGQSFSVAVGGVSLPGGASDTPVRFTINPAPAVPPPDGVASPVLRVPELPRGVPGDPVNCASAASCAEIAQNNYIPGWGFLKDFSDVSYLCVAPAEGGGCSAYNYKVKPASRLTWKQIFR